MGNLEKLHQKRRAVRVQGVGRPRTRKPKPGKAQQMSISLDGAVVQAIDDELAAMNAEGAGPEWTRSDVVRVAVKDWLARRSRAKK